MSGIWLFSTDPDTYSYGRLEKKGRDVWDGVKNPLANRHLRGVRKGDSVLVYHTQKEKCVAALARAASDPYPDPRDPSGRLAAVDVEPVRRLKRRVTLAEIKSNPKLRQMEFVRTPRLSVSQVSVSEWKEIRRLEAAPRA